MFDVAWNTQEVKPAENSLVLVEYQPPGATLVKDSFIVCRYTGGLWVSRGASIFPERLGRWMYVPPLDAEDGAPQGRQYDLLWWGD